MEACSQYANRRAQAREICNRLLTAPFDACHEIVDYDQYHYICMQDFCANGNVKARI